MRKDIKERISLESKCEYRLTSTLFMSLAFIFVLAYAVCNIRKAIGQAEQDPILPRLASNVLGRGPCSVTHLF